MPQTIKVPLTVPAKKRAQYRRNFQAATRGTGRLFLFAGDQKVEHLNDDFFGPGLKPENNDPDHFFKIASKAPIGVFASQLGLIARYGADYPQVPYLIKINSKTNLLKAADSDSISSTWTTAAQVARFKRESGLNVVGIGFTVYLGSNFEHEILAEASQAVIEAHQEGLLAVIWMYPRGKNIKNEEDIHLIAGAAGVALCLGADFVKVRYPYNASEETAKAFAEVTGAAGRCGVICVGGGKMAPLDFLKNLEQQRRFAGTRGNAVGRNLHQYPLAEAIRMAKAINAVAIQGKTAAEGYKIFLGKK
jgi:fructose-bisphosphate aldolase/6-deoxy-5-ketofructose 1-phosphate synthase